MPDLSAHAEAADDTNGPPSEPLPNEAPPPREYGSAPLTPGKIYELHMPDGKATFSAPADACEHIANMMDGGLAIAAFNNENPGVLRDLAAADPEHFQWIQKVADRLGQAMP